MILALTAALVGPLFIDWTVYRDVIESQAGRLVGEDVRILGRTEVRLLPSPRISVETVRVGPEEAPIFTADRVEMEVDLSPLLKREIDVVALTFVGPHVRATVDQAGIIHGPEINLADSPLDWIDPAKVQFDQIDVVDGQILVDDLHTGRATLIDRISLNGSGRSIQGPFEATGDARFEGTPYDFRFATGTYADGAAFPIKARISPRDRAVDFAVDGALDTAQTPEHFIGELTIAPRPDPDVAPEDAPIPWRATGTMDMTAAGLTVREGEIRYGPLERPVVLAAGLDLPFAEARPFRLEVASRQMDLDGVLKALGRSTDTGRPAERIAPLLDALNAVPLVSSEGVVSARLASVVAGGAVIDNIAAEARATADGWRVVKASAGLPGRTRVETSGLLRVGDQISYDGEVSLASSEPGNFARWWRGGTGGAIPVRSDLALDGPITVTASEIAMPALQLKAAGTTLLGSLRYRNRKSDVRGALDLDLRAERLDAAPMVALAQALAVDRPDPAALAEVGSDVTLDLTAGTARYAEAEGQGLTVEATLIDGAFTLDRFEIANLAGARIAASGSFALAGDRPSGALSGTLEATDMAGLGRLVDEVAPATLLARWLAQTGPALAPANLAFEVSGQGMRRSTDLSVALSGTAGATEVAISADMTGTREAWRNGSISGRASLTNPSGDVLLSQLGFDAIPVGDGAASTLEATVDGTPRTGLSTSLTARLVGVDVSADGTLTFEADAAPAVEASVSLTSDDVSALALATGRALPVLVGGTPIELRGRVAGSTDALTVSRVTGSVAGVRVSGEATVDRSETPAKVRGKLRAGEVDGRLLTELVLGPDAWSSAGDTVWPDLGFGAPILGGADVGLDVTTDTLWAGSRRIDDAHFGLVLGPERVRLDDVTGRYAGGDVAGSFALTRSDGQATLATRVALTGADFETLSWQQDGEPVATGTLDLSVQADAIGRSVSGMVAALSGSGTFALKDGVLRHLDPAAFRAAIAAADAGADLQEQAVAEAFERARAGGPLRFDQISGTLAIANGAVRVGEVEVATDAATVDGSGLLDLAKWTASGMLGLSVAPPDPDLVPDATADVTYAFDGPLSSPLATLDAGPLVSYLTLRATEIERRRLELLEKQLQERRAREEELLRKLEAERRAEAERQRKADEEAARIRAAEEEAARQRAEEEARAAAEAAAKAALIAPAAPTPRPEAPLPPIDGALDPIGSIIQRGPTLLRPEPFGPPVEIGPSPGTPRNGPIDLRPRPDQRSQAEPGVAGPFPIAPQDIQ
ncbi:hypothetical protein AB7M35_001392 [Amorphus suaedae]